MKLSTFVDDWLRSWTGNKPHELLNHYSEGAFYADPGHPDGLIGKAHLLPYFTKLLQKNPNWIWEAEEIFPTEKGCTLKWKAQIPVGNETLVLYGMDILEVSEWKITRNEVYFDRKPWLDAVFKLT